MTLTIGETAATTPSTTPRRITRRFRLHSRVQAVEQRERVVRCWKEGGEVRCLKEMLGWFVLLEGSREALFVGDSDPQLTVGQPVGITLEFGDAAA